MLTLLSFVTAPDDTLETETEPVPPMPPPASGLGLHEANPAQATIAANAKTLIHHGWRLVPLKQYGISCPAVPRSGKRQGLPELAPFLSQLD